MYIDTHAHYNLPAFEDDRRETFERMRGVGVSKIICPAITYESNWQMMECLKGFENVYYAVGMHPKRVFPVRKDKRVERVVPHIAKLRDEYESRALVLAELESKLASIAELASNGERVVAVGEAGLDYSLNPGTLERKVQMAVFRAQVEISLKAHLPLVLHVRDAHRDAMHILHMYRTQFRGSAHCFCCGSNEAKEYLAMGFSLGIGGKVTYEQNAGLREAVAMAPLDRILLETDAPYVLPAGFSGFGDKDAACAVPTGFAARRNDSTAIPVIAAEVARLRGITVEEVAEVTTANAERVFFGGM